MKLDFWNNKKRAIIKKYRAAYRGMTTKLAEHHEAQRLMEEYRCQMYTVIRGQLHFNQYASLAYKKEFARFKKTWAEYISYHEQLWPLRCEYSRA